jgi:hypothetical protein
MGSEVYVQGEYLGQFTPATHTKEYELRRQQRIAERKRLEDDTQNSSLKKQFMTLEQFEKAGEVKQRVETIKRTAQHLRMHVLSFFDNTNNQIEPSLFSRQTNDFLCEIDIRMTELISQAKAELEAL